MKLSSCVPWKSESTNPRQNKIRKSEKDGKEGGRLWSSLRQVEQRSSGRNTSPVLREVVETSGSRRSSVGSHSSRRDPRSGHDELKHVRAKLIDWLNAYEVPGDHSQASTILMLQAVYDSSYKYIRKLEGKVTWRDTKIRAQEVEKTAAEQENFRLERKLEDEKADANREISRLMRKLEDEKADANREISHLEQTLTKYESRFAWELEERGRLAATHAAEVVTVNLNQGKREDQLRRENRTALEKLEDQFRTEIQVERQKVKQAEEDMRMNVDNFQALQDAELKDRFYKLNSEIGSLSLLAPAPDFLQRVHAMGRNGQPPPNILPRDQQLLLQSALWATIADGVFGTPFCVFGAYGDPIYQTWAALFSQTELHDWPEADPLAERWRYTTVGRLRRALNSPNAQYGQVQQVQTSYHNNISDLSSRLISLLSSSPGNTYSLTKRLQDLLKQASDFAILISLERCRVRVFVPSALGPHTRRDSIDFKDVYPGNETEMPYATAEFVVAPGLSKEGNSRGGKLEGRMPLFKAAVYFSLEAKADTGN